MRPLRTTIERAFHTSRSLEMKNWLAQQTRSRNDLMKAAARVEEFIYKAICPFANMKHASARMLRNWGFDVSLGGATPIPDDHVLHVFVYAEDDEIKMRMRFQPEKPECADSF